MPEEICAGVSSASRSPPRRELVNPLHRRTSRQLSLACIVVAVLAGCALRAWQYLADTSLWLDEIALVRGILDRDVRSLLLVPMPYGQVAPKAFLLAQKLAVLALGPSDRSLRLLPFL